MDRLEAIRFYARNRLRIHAALNPRLPAQRVSEPSPTPPAVPSAPAHFRVAVIGAGFGGLGAGIRLLESGITDFVVLERSSSVGGTWRDNTYPGCSCDVRSNLYSFSFAPNPRWSHTYAPQNEIRDYLEDVADSRGLRRHLRFDTEVTSLRWDETANRWQAATTQGDLTADVVVSATGPLSEPALPDVPGLGTFPGEVFHSARWNHDCDLNGKRVAVVGTGSSAIQIVPAIQPIVGRLTVFQRTPTWVLRRPNRRVTAVEQWLYERIPPLQRLARFGDFAAREWFIGAFIKHPMMMKALQRRARNNLAKSISDPELRARLTPDHVIGCRRILLSNHFYPALARPNVDVVASGLAGIEGSTLIAQDGSVHEADVIVLATGFRFVGIAFAERVRGRGGVSLAEASPGDFQALRGTTVAGFPNLCLVMGPNSALLHSSVVQIIESQLNYIIDYIKTLDRLGIAALDVTTRAQERWSAELERRMAPTVWATGGCVSPYRSETGRIFVPWPGSILAFRRATRRVDLGEYDLIRARSAEHHRVLL